MFLTILRALESLNPRNDRIQAMVAAAYMRAALQESDQGRRAALAEQARRRLDGLVSPDERLGPEGKVLLYRLALSTFESGDLETAKRHSEQLLNNFPPLPEAGGNEREQLWMAWDIYRSTHLLLGRIHLVMNDLDSAGLHLVQAGEAPTTPALESYGPDLSLARDLLTLGANGPVLKFLSALGTRWKAGKSRTETWEMDIRRGVVPKDRVWQTSR